MTESAVNKEANGDVCQQQHRAVNGGVKPGSSSRNGALKDQQHCHQRAFYKRDEKVSSP